MVVGPLSISYPLLDSEPPSYILRRVTLAASPLDLGAILSVLEERLVIAAAAGSLGDPSGLRPILGSIFLALYLAWTADAPVQFSRN